MMFRSQYWDSNVGVGYELQKQFNLDHNNARCIKLTSKSFKFKLIKIINLSITSCFLYIWEQVFKFSLIFMRLKQRLRSNNTN
jgi:hypothetical protein